MKWRTVSPFVASSTLPFGYAQVADITRRGRWSWNLAAYVHGFRLQAHSARPSKSVAGAKRSCAKAARRLGLC